MTILDVQRIPGCRTALGHQNAVSAARRNLDVGREGVRPVPGRRRERAEEVRAAGIERIETASSRRGRIGMLPAVDARVDRVDLVPGRLLLEQPLQLLELVRSCAGEVVRLGKVVTEVVQLPVRRRLVRAEGVGPRQQPRALRGDPPSAVDGSVPMHLEVLPRPMFGCRPGGQHVEEADAVDRLLLDPVDQSGLRQSRGLENGREQVDDVQVLPARRPGVLDAGRPGHHHRISRPAQVRANPLAPLERRVARPGPAGRVVRVRHRPSDVVEAAQHLSHGCLDAVHLLHDVVGSAESALEARAVVAGDVDHERVVELPGLAEGVEDAPDLEVDLCQETREHLHQPRGDLFPIGAQ